MIKVICLSALILLIGLCHGETNFQGRIVGGEDISNYYVSYIAQIRRRSSTTSAYAQTCGASLLDNRTLVTAAHCVYNRLAENFLIVGGTDQRAGMDGYVTRAEKIVIHDLYNASITDNDIALIFLSPALPIREDNIKLSAISVASERPSVGTYATVSGWGTTTESGLSSNLLQQVQVPVVDSTSCQEAYDWRPISDGMLCAGLPNGGKDACQGDSGGPLVVNSQLVGIVSWGEGCARANYPGVYTNVAYFKNWIDQQRASNALV
ncbi:trypsin eta [Drosophila tropicalis]|uniref:trypsin eta n=1 Tax=Drosophila tropicalis TaxID=46794 RepID=UPI0035ABD8C4